MENRCILRLSCFNAPGWLRWSVTCSIQAFNACIRNSHAWPASLTLPFFKLTSDLIRLTRQLPTSIHGAQELINHELHCHFAYLAGKVNDTLNLDVENSASVSYGFTNSSVYLSLAWTSFYDVKLGPSTEILDSIATVISLCDEVEITSTEPQSSQKIRMVRACLCVWEFEAHRMSKDWDAIRKQLKVCRPHHHHPSSIEPNIGTLKVVTKPSWFKRLCHIGCPGDHRR